MKTTNKKQNIEQNQDSLNQEFRPDSLGEVIGQEPVIETLINSILYSNIPNSIIAQGSKGTGKTSTARAYAKTLNCENVQEAIKPYIEMIKTNPKANISFEELKNAVKPCNSCPACESFNKSPLYAGVTEIDAGSEGKIDEVRELKTSLNYSGGFKYRVVIIDEAHNMSEGGKTALLKVIEEPPKNVVFIFATTHPDDLLPTIKSRSIILKFNGVDDDLIEKHLERIAYKKQIDISKKALKALASSTEGGVRDAIKNLQHASLKCKRRTIEVQDLQDIIDIEPEYIDEVMDLMFNGNIEDLISKLNKTFSSRKLSIENIHLDYFISKIRNRLYSSTNQEERRLLTSVYKVFVGEKERFMYNVSPRIAIETAVLESFDLISNANILELKKSTVSKKESVTKTIQKQDAENINNNTESINNMPSDCMVVSKKELFINMFKLIFNEKAQEIVFSSSEIEYNLEKDAICFYVKTKEEAEAIKKVLKTELAQRMKMIAQFKGFVVKIK